MQTFTIVAKFEGSGVSVTFTENEREKSEQGITTIEGKKYGKDFKTRAAAAEAIDLQFRRFLKTLGAPPPEQLELKSEEPKKPKSKKKNANLKAVPAPAAEAEKTT
jgi:hypothetical protein